MCAGKIGAIDVTERQKQLVDDLSRVRSANCESVGPPSGEVCCRQPM